MRVLRRRSAHPASGTSGPVEQCACHANAAVNYTEFLGSSRRWQGVAGPSWGLAAPARPRW
ncbi:hypothetical protein DB32_006456 [Sandaracinus amylolyticus]|uniref:Uncharacterized protein n=1 Tax=Sandaracinus amylolyticus TaxID=927083 RepID=A0A0F6YLK8_9BACT|nr:hypothetical protein DB32_006456 [Sandaracinus amylolyticus]